MDKFVTRTAPAREPGKVRVGRRVYSRGGAFTDPDNLPDFTTILCLTPSTEYGALSPYSVTDDDGRNMENIWQFSKVYEKVPKSKQTYSRYNSRVIWEHPAETHVANGRLTPEYWAWRRKGFAAKDAVRYPVGFYARRTCVGCVLENEPAEDGQPEHKFLNYVEARKAIYLPVYTKLLQAYPMFHQLRKRLERGENLLIVEVDGPHQEDSAYYQTKYAAPPNFIEGNSVEVTEFSMRVLLNDTKHPFGHGYCLAMALLGKEKEWNRDLPAIPTPSAKRKVQEEDQSGGQAKKL